MPQPSQPIHIERTDLKAVWCSHEDKVKSSVGHKGKVTCSTFFGAPYPAGKGVAHHNIAVTPKAQAHIKVKADVRLALRPFLQVDGESGKEEKKLVMLDITVVYSDA